MSGPPLRKITVQWTGPRVFDAEVHDAETGERLTTRIPIEFAAELRRCGGPFPAFMYRLNESGAFYLDKERDRPAIEEVTFLVVEVVQWSQP